MKAKEKKPSYSRHISTRLWSGGFEKIRAAVSLRLHKPMTTCMDTVADWRLIYRVLLFISQYP